MKKPIEDYDLDIMNALKDFPHNNEDSFMYIRSKIDRKKDKLEPGFIHTKATNETLAVMIYSFMATDETAKEAVFNAVISYVKNNKEESEFLKHF